MKAPAYATLPITPRRVADPAIWGGSLRRSPYSIHEGRGWEALTMVTRMTADVRRIVLGGGAFPPYQRSGAQLAGSITRIMEP